MEEPSHDIAHLLNYAQLTALEELAEARGVSVEKLVQNVIDNYILRETGQSN